MTPKLIHRNVISQTVNSKDCALNVRKNNSIKINTTYTKKKNLKNKLDMLIIISNVTEYINIKMISKTQHDDRSLHALHHLNGFPNACR